jgi:hypothetical protein
MELEPNNPTNKKDMKELNDIKITESLILKAIENDQFDKAVTNLNALLKDCSHSIKHVCLKIECMLKAF